MKRMILGATIALIALSSHAKSPEVSAADLARLKAVTQDEYVALIHTVNECRFEASPRTAAALLRSPAMPAITAAVARTDGPLPVLDAAACASLGKF
jgi:hypothetical protein